MARRVFDTAVLTATERYKLMAGFIVPRPIGWVGTRSPVGADNLAPFSFFNMVSASPPTLLFTTSMANRVKDTLRNVRSTGVFTVNVVTEDLATAMNVTSGEYPPETDEFEIARLAKEQAVTIDAPLVAGAKAGFECVVVHIQEVGDPPTAAVVFGRVDRIHAEESVLDGTRVDFERLGAVGRLAGPWYTRVDDLFEMQRPRLD